MVILRMAWEPGQEASSSVETHGSLRRCVGFSNHFVFPFLPASLGDPGPNASFTQSPARALRRRAEPR